MCSFLGSKTGLLADASQSARWLSGGGLGRRASNPGDGLLTASPFRWLLWAAGPLLRSSSLRPRWRAFGELALCCVLNRRGFSARVGSRGSHASRRPRVRAGARRVRASFHASTRPSGVLVADDSLRGLPLGTAARPRSPFSVRAGATPWATPRAWVQYPPGVSLGVVARRWAGLHRDRP